MSIKICDCNQCTALLNRKEDGRLEIWYGRGSNGKTTLLNTLTKKWYITNFTSIDSSPPFVKIFILVLYKSHKQEIKYFLANSNIDPTKRYIIETNTLPEGIDFNNPKIDLIHFTHTFPTDVHPNSHDKKQSDNTLVD